MRDVNRFDIEANNNLFLTDADSRRRFVSKVYMILMCQLVVTFGCIALFVYNDDVKQIPLRNPQLVWVALGTTIVLIFALACCENVRRKSPMNFVCLALFTLAQSFLLGCVASIYAPNEVLLAVGITACLCFVLTIFSIQTKCDFTACGGILLAAVVLIVIFGVVMIFFPSKLMMFIYAGAGAFIFSLLLIYDTQLMLGGEHKYAISEEDYIFAALSIYLDIVNIFTYILTLIGLSND